MYSFPAQLLDIRAGNLIVWHIFRQKLNEIFKLLISYQRSEGKDFLGKVFSLSDTKSIGNLCNLTNYL